jgi:hypothetical protein
LALHRLGAGTSSMTDAGRAIWGGPAASGWCVA